MPNLPAARITETTAKGGKNVKGDPTVLIGGGGLGGGESPFAGVMSRVCVSLGQQLFENQAAGMESPYSRRAAQIAQRADAAAPGRASCTGHSLGGGLASAAATVNGSPARTFNAASLSRNTLDRYGCATGGIGACHLNKDPLNLLQDSTSAADAVGNRRGCPVTEIWSASARVPLGQPSNPYVPDFIERRALHAQQAAREKGKPAIALFWYG